MKTIKKLSTTWPAVLLGATIASVVTLVILISPTAKAQTEPDLNPDYEVFPVMLEAFPVGVSLARNECTATVVKLGGVGGPRMDNALDGQAVPAAIVALSMCNNNGVVDFDFFDIEGAIEPMEPGD